MPHFVCMLLWFRYNNVIFVFLMTIIVRWWGNKGKLIERETIWGLWAFKPFLRWPSLLRRERSSDSGATMKRITMDFANKRYERQESLILVWKVKYISFTYLLVSMQKKKYILHIFLCLFRRKCVFWYLCRRKYKFYVFRCLCSACIPLSLSGAPLVFVETCRGCDIVLCVVIILMGPATKYK